MTFDIGREVRDDPELDKFLTFLVSSVLPTCLANFFQVNIKVKDIE